MSKHKPSEEIDQRMKDLAREYSKTPLEDPWRAAIESEISALCLQRWIQQELRDLYRGEH